MTTAEAEPRALQDEIEHLERQLAEAKLRLKKSNGGAGEHRDIITGGITIAPDLNPNTNTFSLLAPDPSSLHTLLLLADSALPLGSFAFSSGLESYLAHYQHGLSPSLKPNQPRSTQISLFHKFLDLSLNSLASTALPYVLAAHREPKRLEELDNDFDASTVCNVARRASVAQGRALLSVWERAFRSQYKDCADGVLEVLRDFSSSLRASASNPYPPSAHYAPLWGAITLALGLPLHSSAYLFLFSHARTVVSAAVRASVLGPYQAQGVLASMGLKERIEGLVREYWDWRTEEAGQCVPVVDLWVGRHELLYSRIFNS